MRCDKCGLEPRPKNLSRIISTSIALSGSDVERCSQEQLNELIRHLLENAKEHLYWGIGQYRRGR